MVEQIQQVDDGREYVLPAHCVRVLGYAVDYEAHELSISTEQQGKRLALRFKGLLAHHFDHAGCRNVIYDVSAVPLDEFIDSERRQLARALRYGYPLGESRGLEEMRQYLKEQGYSVFEIRASVGLCGYVIAKSLVIEAAGQAPL